MIVQEQPYFSVESAKSAKIDAKALAIHIIAFANTDGGTLVIGIEDNGDITGIDGYKKISMSCSVHRLPLFSNHGCF